MPVTSRSLRRHGNHTISTRASAAVIASIIGAAGAAWAVANVFEPYSGNLAKTANEFPPEESTAPTDPIGFALPLVGAPAEDVAAGSPSAWRSESSLLRIADSLNTAVTPTGGSQTDGGTGDGGGGNNGWILPTPGRDILLPDGGDGSDDGESPWLARPSIEAPGGDGTPAACAAETLAIVESPNESAIVPGRVIDKALPANCQEEAEEAGATASSEQAPAEEAPAEGSSSSID